MGTDLPTNTTYTLDGSLVLPPGSDVVKSDDGSVTVDGKTLPPGTKVQTLPDGSIVISHQPPVSAQKNPDGSINIGGAKLPTAAQLSKNGNIVLPKSSQVTHRPDGSVSVDGQTLPPGTCVQMLEDGSYLILNNCSNVN